MGKGRRPAPGKIKIHNASRAAEASRTVIKVRKPGGLEPEAVAEWDRLAPNLIKTGHLTNDNLSLFVNLCNLRAIVKKCQSSIENEGPTVSTATGGDKINPAAAVMFAAMSEQRRLHAAFGINSKVVVASEDDLDAFCKTG